MELMSCEGAPRDLGVDQGRACARSIRAACAGLGVGERLTRWLPLLPAPAEARAVERDLRRYFPHLAERTAGLARGAGVARAELAALLGRELGAGGSACAGAILAVEGEGGAGALLARSVLLPAALRRSRPDNDYASAELVSPGLVAPLIGVNEHGLAVAAIPLPRRREEPGPSCAAPALLLAQDCLQRFDTTQKALEWCERRPAGGAAALAFADVSGDVAEIRIEGAGRSASRAEGGILVAASEPSAAAALRKRLAELGARDAASLSGLLGEGGPGAAVADPRERRIEWDGFAARVREGPAV